MPLRRRVALTLAVTAAVTAVTLTAVTWSASATPADDIDWQPCPQAPDVDCGSVTVPLDWDDPDGPTIDIALARRPATDPDARIGAVVMDPGGPGGSGVDLVTAESVLTPATEARFDTIGFDPRGVGASHPVTCDAALVAEAQQTMYPRSAAEFAATRETTEQVARDCRERTGELYDHVDTESVARDIDVIRASLDEPKLTYVGYSYGTLMGQEYAQLFPERIRAMVLDGNMDHSMTSTWRSMSTQLAAVEEIFVDFADWCDAEPDCALYGMDTRTVYGGLRDAARAGELVDPTTGRTMDLTQFSGLVPHWAKQTQWPTLADTLAVLAGEAEPAADTARLLTEATPEINVPDQAIWCQDWDFPVRNWRQWSSLTEQLADEYPNTQWTVNLGLSLMCLGYPGPTTNPQARLDIEGAPPLVMLGNRHDPSTVYPWTLAAAEQSGATLITYEGYGHTIYAYGRPSACVNDTVDDYLIDLTVPPDGLTCPDALTPGSVGAETVGPEPGTGTRY